MSEVVNIPQLRFPGFNGRWSCELFNNIVSVIDGDRGVNYPKSNDFFSDEYCLFLSAKNVTKNGFIFNETQFIKKERDELLRKGKLSRGDIVLTTRGTVGQFAFYSDEVTYNNIRINSGMVLLRNSNDNLLNSYFFKACNSFQISRQIKIVAFGSAQPQLTVKEINKIKINLPTKPEQQKIAAFLTAVDNKIEQLSKKQALLSEYKKGLMQQIFSQVIRFKVDDGSDFPDWEERKLGDVGKVYQPKTISQTDLTTKGFDVYGANGIIGKYSEYNHEFEQIAVTCRGNTCGTVNFTKPKSWITGNAMVVNVDDSKVVNKTFIYYQLSHTNLTYLITGSGQPQITGDIKTHKVKIPSLPEQTKIANFLSSIDNKIEQVGKQLDESKQFKKALLQQMFV
jgi:type I restriction enzyme S subunit